MCTLVPPAELGKLFPDVTTRMTILIRDLVFICLILIINELIRFNWFLILKHFEELCAVFLFIFWIKRVLVPKFVIINHSN